MSDEPFDARSFLATVPTRPGCYRMYDRGDEIIYVGKAADLRKRLASYFVKTQTSPKTRALLAHIHHIEFTVTFSETEALILENNLIKQHQPRYNILLRDDKSYPYIFLSQDRHPGLFYHRGPRTARGDYFGPYPHSSAVRESLRLMQKIFPIRQCADSVYAHRTRPCLMAQMGRCLAPCVPMTQEAEDNYQAQVELARLFLRGRNQEVLNRLTERMEEKAQCQEYEQAARLRDQLLALRKVQESQAVSTDSDDDLDVIALRSAGGLCCVHILFIRTGRIIGTRSYFPRLPSDEDQGTVLNSFLKQYYLSSRHQDMLPRQIILDAAQDPEDEQLLQAALQECCGRRIEFNRRPGGHRQRYLTLAGSNAKASLAARLAARHTQQERMASLEEILGVREVRRMECYDISHTMGELAVASCVVFGREGPDTSRYRRYNITGIVGGDDYAAMRQVLQRRFRQVTAEDRPDIVFIDGGRGQLHQAEEVLYERFGGAGVELPLLIGVAKGEGRREGLETLIVGFTREEYHLTLEDPALQLILHVRDESHRFAITGHRNRRQKARVSSFLEDVPGVGAKRRQALLRHLGGRQEIMRAGVEDLAKVPGISRDLAGRIYDALHNEL